MSRMLATLVSAALYALAFPPASLRPLAWLSLAPFFAAVAGVSALRGAALGLIWAVAATAGVTWWFPRMLEGFFELRAPLALAALGALAVFAVGPAYAVFGAWLAWVSRCRAAAPWLVAAGWTCAEWARAHGPLGSPWALSGYAAVGTPWIQSADLGGPYLAGSLLAAANAALASLVRANWTRGPDPFSTRSTRRAGVHVVGVAAVAAAAGVYGLWRLGERYGEGEPIPVAVVQGGLTWSFRFDPSQSEAHLRRYLELGAQARAAAPRLVVWPEHAVDFYLRDPGPERDALLAVQGDGAPDLVLGAPHYARDQGAVRYLNSVFLLSQGRVAARSDKTRLVPFAEHSPFGAWLADWSGHYAPGAGPRVLPAAAAPVGAFLCAEAMDPDAARRLAADGAELLANPSNDFWFSAAPAARLQLETASVRAIEERRWLLRATPTGYSALVDPHGRVAALSEYGAASVLHGEVRRSRAVTVYQRLGDAPLGVAAAAVVLASAGRARRRPAPGLRP
jgi:apolipoprotein N-acyltransferase